MERRDGKFILLTPEYPPDRGGIAEYLYSIVQNFHGDVKVLCGPFFWKNIGRIGLKVFLPPGKRLNITSLI